MSTDTPDTTKQRETSRDDRDFEVDQSIDVESLIAKEQTLPFLGLTPADTDSASYPVDVDPVGRRFLDPKSDTKRSLKTLIKAIPEASSGQLRAINAFVDGDTRTVDSADIRAVEGLDVDALEAATGQSLEELVANAPGDRFLDVTDHQDIIDHRRLALHTLGYPVKFRWQIATDSYTIVNPPDAYLPLVGALQQHGAADAFGWAHTRDWGGVAKLSIILPGFRRELTLHQHDGDAAMSTAVRRHEALANADLTVSDSSDQDADNTNETEDDDTPATTVYGGIQTGYDFRGSQKVWAKPLLFFPESGTIMYGVGKRYSRRHVGDVMDAAHERAHDRVPIMEWWEEIYSALDRRTTTVNEYLVRARAVAINFSELPYGISDFYVYLGIPNTYAETAGTRAKRLADSEVRPTLWNLQLSLLVALDDFGGSRASDTFQAYNEVAQHILFSPEKAIQLAAREHDLQADDDEPTIAPDQQTLSDALGDAFDIPGVEVTSEKDLSHVDAQHVQDTIQHSLDT